MRSAVDFEKEYGPKEEMPGGEEPAQGLACPHCNTIIQYFTFFRCEPIESLSEEHGVENYEDDENLDPDTAVRCDHCSEFLPGRFYDPLSAMLCAAAAEEDDDDPDAATD